MSKAKVERVHVINRGPICLKQGRGVWNRKALPKGLISHRSIRSAERCSNRVTDWDEPGILFKIAEERLL